MGTILQIDDRYPQKLISGLVESIKKIATVAGIKRKKAKNNTLLNTPWYDTECNKKKLQIRNLGFHLKKEPHNTGLRTNLHMEKRQYKNMLKRKKKTYKLNTIKEMSFNRREGKKFWKCLNKLDSYKSDESFITKISAENWIKHFEDTLIGTKEPIYSRNSVDQGPLDYDITLEEITEASYILKNGKACGIDKIPNEMLKCLVKTKPEIIIKIFNSILHYKNTSNVWDFSILTPIHKKGPKTETSNYRGISLLSCINRLFSAILNKRLTEFVKNKNILSEVQLGFISGSRTSDAHFLIHYLIQQYCHRSTQKLYACFIDFKKAFDSIPRDKLLKKLLNFGITGDFYNTIKNMYMNDKCKIKIGKDITDAIYPNQGVRQGCVLSPLLFNIYMCDLPKTLNNDNCQPAKIGQRKIPCIMWADDLVIFSESDYGLQTMLTELGKYTDNNGLEINVDKTKCMIFNKTGRLIHRNYKHKKMHIKTVREYKYLGFIITPSGEINTGLQDLKARSQRAIYALRDKMGEYFQIYFSVTLKLFHALIKPILLYLSDFWGYLKLPVNNPIDTGQMSFLKQLLGVQTQTTNVGILLETGEIPLNIHAKYMAFKNWCRFAKKESNNLVLYAYDIAYRQDQIWVKRIKEGLNNIGLAFLHLNQGKNNAATIFMQRQRDIFHQKAFEDIRNENSKLRTYSLLKTEIGKEKYLDKILNLDSRITLTKTRLSNHALMIEQGRHLKMHKTQRHCKFCPVQIEDEYHFVMECRAYAQPRMQLFDKISNEMGNEIRNIEKKILFTIILANVGICHITSKYLKIFFEIRQFLIKERKNPM